MTDSSCRGRRLWLVGGLALVLVGAAVVAFSWRGSIKEAVRERVRPGPKPPGWTSSVTTAPPEPPPPAKDRVLQMRVEDLVKEN